MEYLSNKQLKRHTKRARKILDELNDRLGFDWEINYTLVGSASRNLVIPSNKGFDFDYHIHLLKTPSNLSPKKIKNKFKLELDKIVKKYTFGPCEDSTHVLTTKKILNGKILYSYDFALLRKKGKKAEILKNRKNGKVDDYQFIQIPDYPIYIKNLEKIKKPKHVDFLRDVYYNMKVKEQNIKKDDRSLSISLLLIVINMTIQKFNIK